MAKRGKHKQKGHVGVSPGPRPSSVATAAAGGSPGESARRGLDAFERGEYGSAVQFWTQARRAGGPESLHLALGEAHFRRALAATTDGRRAQELREAVALAPDRAVYQYHLGLALQRQGQLRPALQAYQAALHLDPGSERYRRQLLLARLEDAPPDGQPADLLAESLSGGESAARLAALAALRRQQPEDAEAALAGLTTDDPLTGLVRGAAQLAAGRVEAAVQSFARARIGDGPGAGQACPAATVATVLALHRTGELGAALTALRSVVLPTDDATRRAVGTVARALGRDLVLNVWLDDALAALEQALAAEPRHAATRRLVSHLHEVLATQAARAEAYAEAASHWQAALAEQPGQTRIIHNLALVAERQEDWDLAATYWEQLIGLWKRELRGARRNDEIAADLRRRLTIAHRRLADAHDAADDLVEAIRALERALHLDATDVELRLRAAELALENEQYGVAIDHLRRVLAARPDDVRALIDLGTAYDLNGDDRQGQTVLERALTLEPGHTAALAALATVHHERSHRVLDTGQTDRAFVEMDRAIELEPDVTRHLECLGTMHLKRGDLAAAKKIFDRIIAMDPDDIRMRVKVGATYLAQGYEKEAQGRFRQILRKWPGPVGHVAIGMAYARVGQMATAHRHFKHLLDLNDAPSLQALGKSLNDLHRELDAERYLDRAAKLDPTSAHVHVHLAWVYAFGHHDYDGAQAKLDQARPLAEADGDADLLAEIEVASQTVATLQKQAALPVDEDDLFALPPGLFR